MKLLNFLSKQRVWLFNKDTLDMQPLPRTKLVFFVFLISTTIAFSSYTYGRLTKIENLTEYEKELLVIDLQRDEFSQEKLIELLIKLKVKFPDIVLAQARLETGAYKSKIFRENHNLFGMKEASRRINTAVGTQYNHAYYEHWRESVYDYAFYQCRYFGSVSSESQYISSLGQSYAEDPDYVQKLKNEINKNNLKKYFK
jgi:uncharacterized FlgJ-related protein